MLADLEIIEVKDKKLNKMKLAFVVIVILTLISGIVLLFYAKQQNQNLAQEKQQEKAHQEQLAMSKTKHSIDKSNFSLPNLTDIGKEKMKHIYHSDQKTAYLTFDDGPSRSVTPLILDYLKQENIKATFFTLGSRVELAPELVKREYEEGHYIANHGYSHVYQNIYASPECVLEEYNHTEQCIKNALGNQNYNSHLFRFPGGSSGGKYKEVKQQAITLLEQNNVVHVDWNSLTQDAAGAHTKEQLLENLKNTVNGKSSVVILMHDAGDKILTYEVLPEIVHYLREQGYCFKNFYDIIQ